MLLRILLAVETETTRRRLRRLLDQSRLALTTDADARRLWQSVCHESFDLLLASRTSLPEEPVAALMAIRQLPDRPEIVLLHPIEDPEAAERAELLAAGCLAVLDPRGSDDLLGTTLETVLKRRQDQGMCRLSVEQQADSCSLADFASAAPAMHELLELAHAVAPSSSSVLLLGETGARRKVSNSFERAYLIDTLRCCSGRIGKSARRAGVSPRSMSEMIKRHGMSKADFQ